MQVQVSLKIELEATAGITQMEQQIQEAGQLAMREAFKRAIRQREDHTAACPHCGEKLFRLEGTTRREIATVFGRVQVPRRRFRCQGCLLRFCPATALFAKLEGGRISVPLQEAALLAGCSWPYRVASQLLKRLSGAQISAEEIRRLINEEGHQRDECQQKEAEQAKSETAKEGSEGKAAPEPLLVGMDGGWVCSREQRAGMEGKVAVVCSKTEELPMPGLDTTFSWSKRGGPRRPPRQRHRLARRRYVATFGPSHELGVQAGAAAVVLSEQRCGSVVVIADGAAWIKKQVDKYFPQAICILDWAHLWREVSHAIRVGARAKSLSTHQRDFQLHFHQSCLWQGNVDQAISGLHRLASQLPPEALKVVREAIGYLHHQRDWIGSYERWKALGYPVGSGMIERAVALVVNRRMKKRGMRWCRTNATAMVALRTDLLNDDWIAPQQMRSFP